MKLGLLPNVGAIINEKVTDKGQVITHWHNFLQGIQTAIESGQSIGLPISIVATDGINLGQCIKSSIKRVISSTSGDTTVTKNPQISAGFDGQEVTIEGSDSVKTVTLTNGNGLQLANGASIILKNGDIIKLHYNASRAIWIENYRSINS